MAAGGGGGGRGAAPPAGGRGGRGGGAAIAFYKTIDGGDHWFLATDDPRVSEMGSQRHPPDTRPLGRIGGGDLPTITIDPTDENVVYSCSTVFWRTEDGGLTWTAVRGAPGGDDYQKSWVNPNNPSIILLVSDQGAVVSANRGTLVEQLVHPADGRHVSRHRRQRLPLSPMQRPAGFRLRLRR